MFPAMVVRTEVDCSMKISGAVPVAMMVLSMIEVSGEVSLMKMLYEVAPPPPLLYR